MNCAEYQQMISSFIDHEKKAAESGELFEHLAGCPQCRDFLDNLMRLNFELEKAQASAELEKELGSSLQRDLTWKRNPQSVRIPQTGIGRWRTAALLALLVLLTGLFWSSTVPRQGEDQISDTQQAQQTEMPNYQP